MTITETKLLTADDLLRVLDGADVLAGFTVTLDAVFGPA
jgi:hypothetical protein